MNEEEKNALDDIKDFINIYRSSRYFVPSNDTIIDNLELLIYTAYRQEHKINELEEDIENYKGLLKAKMMILGFEHDDNYIHKGKIVDLYNNWINDIDCFKSDILDDIEKLLRE